MRHEAEKSEKYERMIKMYLIGWAVITLIYIVSVVLIRKECKKYKQIVTENAEAYCSGVEAAADELRKELGQKEKELADERNKITELTGNFDEMIRERIHLGVIVCSLEKEKISLKKECEIYQAILIEHGLWTEPTEAAPDEGTYEEAVEETPAELPPGEIVCDEVEEENNPSVSEADSSLCTEEPLMEVENEEVD